MKFGTSTMFFRERNVLAVLPLIAEAGYDHAEVWYEHLIWSNQEPERVGEEAVRVGLELTMHGPTYDANVTSTNPGIRQESRRQVRDCLRYASAMRAQVVVIHPGRRSSSRDLAEDFWPLLLDFAADLSKWAQSEGVDVGVELMERRPKEYFMSTADGARLMAASLERIGLTIDIAHLYTHGQPLGQLNELEPDWIRHVHLSDGRPDRTHVPLGQGEINIPAVLKALAKFYQGTVSLEGYEPGKGVEIITRNLRYLKDLRRWEGGE